MRGAFWVPERAGAQEGPGLCSHKMPVVSGWDQVLGGRGGRGPIYRDTGSMAERRSGVGGGHGHSRRVLSFSKGARALGGWTCEDGEGQLEISKRGGKSAQGRAMGLLESPKLPAKGASGRSFCGTSSTEVVSLPAGATGCGAESWSGGCWVPRQWELHPEILQSTGDHDGGPQSGSWGEE